MPLEDYKIGIEFVFNIFTKASNQKAIALRKKQEVGKKKSQNKILALSVVA